MARFLVTGGAGFIGSNIAETLCKRGDSVLILDDFSTGKQENIAHLGDGIQVMRASVADLAACRRAVEGVEFVLHLAALPSVQRSVEDPLAAHAANLTGTLNMLIAARDQGVERFVFAASSAAYGDLPTLPKAEDMPTNPLSPYSVQKLTGEMYCRIFFSLYGLPTIALRYFNVFGPRQDPASQYAAAVPLFVTRLLANRAPTIYGDGEQSRDFTPVDNVIQANLLACEAPKEAFGEVYNIACGERISVNRLASLIRDIVGTETPFEYADARPGDVKHSLADIGKARRLLGYAPQVSFRDGLERVIAWYRARQ